MSQEPFDLLYVNKLLARADTGFAGEETAALANAVRYIKEKGKYVRDFQMVLAGDVAPEIRNQIRLEERRSVEAEKREYYAAVKALYPRDLNVLRQRLEETQTKLRAAEAAMKRNSEALTMAEKLAKGVDRRDVEIDDLKEKVSTLTRDLRKSETELRRLQARTEKFEAENLQLREKTKVMEKDLKEKDKELAAKIDKNLQVILLRQAVTNIAGTRDMSPMPSSELAERVGEAFPGLTLKDFLEAMGYQEAPDPVPAWLRAALRGMKAPPVVKPRKARAPNHFTEK